MAKKTLAERLKAIDSISNDINKNAGKTIVGRLSNTEELKEKLKTRFIPTPSINVNEAIGGGWPIGNISIVSGLEDSGKTALLLETIACEQKRNPDFVALWLESEVSLKETMLEMFEIDRGRFVVIEHEKEGAGEEAVTRLEAFLASGNFDMCVINSLKALVPSEEFKKSMGEVQVGVQSRMNSKLMRKLTAIVQENEVALVIVQHLTTKIGAGKYEESMVLAGGVAIKYGAILIVDMRKRSIQESDPIKREDGMKIAFIVKKNHVVTDRYPYVKTEYYVIYGQGIEVYLEVLDLAIRQGVLVKNGAFIKLPDEEGNARVINGEKMQWQGSVKFRNYCIDNPDFFENLKMAIKGNVTELTEEEIESVKGEDFDSDEDILEDVIEKANNAKTKKKK